ncbi:MAG TPA: histidine kinase [Vicinamibacterales bacterium]
MAGYSLAWLVLSTLFATLMFLYRHLEHVASRNDVPAIIPLIEQFTGVFCAAVFFPVIARVARRFPLDEGRWRRNVPVHIVALAAFSPVHTTCNWITREVWFRLAGLGDYDYGVMPIRYLMELPIDIVLYTIFVCVVWIVDRRSADREQALQTAQLHAQLTEAQLRSLRLQLQPHFLFNALNTISSAMYDDPRAADTMLAHLSDLLRVSLRTDQADQVALASELEALSHYTALLQARFGERLQLEVDVPDALRDVRVPSLVLQPLVENAVRHGNLTRTGNGRIVVRARQDGDRIRLDVEDDGPGLQAASVAASAAGNGVGLAATRERLRLLYGDAHGVSLAASPLGGLLVRLEIPVDPAHARADRGR